MSAFLVSLPITAAILPEDRADALYHRYEGGGVTVDGPSILARFSVGKSWSIFGNVYMDSVSSASIDVETYASPYTEERFQYSAGFDYLYDKTTMSFSYTNSEEYDYSAESFDFGISHDMFGDLTTVSLGVSRGFDNVRQTVYQGTGADKTRVKAVDKGDIDRYKFRLGLSQILTKNFLINLGMETISDEGETLNNPYRNAFYVDPDTNLIRLTGEQYPNTRTSTAFSLRAKYFLPWRAAIHAEGRSFSDSWDIEAQMFDIGFTQPIKKSWIFDIHYRIYSQTAASFYSNIFLDGPQEFMARDKELSTFTSTTIGGTVSYEFLQKRWWVFDRGSVSLSYDRLQFDYEDFLDVRDPNRDNKYFRGLNDFVNAPQYSFSADVIRFYISAWF